jgi:hypothetical protein
MGLNTNVLFLCYSAYAVALRWAIPQYQELFEMFRSFTASKLNPTVTNRRQVKARMT